MYEAARVMVRKVEAMDGEPKRIRLRAHAKLNLALAVGPAVDNPGSSTHGYHPICSYMHAIELHDSIEIERRDETRYDIHWTHPDGTSGAVEWAIESDLIVRAHRAIEQRAGRALPCSIRCRKSIPAGGGLGGGSSNAASVLVGLNHLFELGFEQETLVEIAMTIGSDIAYFIDGFHSPPRPAVVSGFGDQIERVRTTHADQELTLIFPEFGCPTGEVYRAFDSIVDWDTPDTHRVARIVDAEVLSDAHIMNDLYQPACVVQPALGSLRDRIAAHLGQGVHLSGSGSTLFVLGRIAPSMVHEVASDCRVVHTRLC